MLAKTIVTIIGRRRRRRKTIYGHKHKHRYQIISNTWIARFFPTSARDNGPFGSSSYTSLAVSPWVSAGNQSFSHVYIYICTYYLHVYTSVCVNIWVCVYKMYIFQCTCGLDGSICGFSQSKWLSLSFSPNLQENQKIGFDHTSTLDSLELRS